MSNSQREAGISENRPADTSYPAFVLVTPARNEAGFIEGTIKSVVAQTVRPRKWVIVSDGSTDGTDDIVTKYAAEHAWIELIRMPERKERHFAGKVMAFNAGFERVKALPYEVIGNLDADITFDSDYFRFLLSKFVANPKLGVGGTPFREGTQQYDYRFTNIEHVSGACQLFRRVCFEAIGGYKPIRVGGVDLMAVLTARMMGWQTRTFTEKVCDHHRKMGTGNHKGLMVAFKGGQTDYVLGVHPVWEFFRSVYQMTNKPLLFGGALRLIGFYWALLRRVDLCVSRDLMEFRRKEQMSRLRDFFTKTLRRGVLAERSQQNAADSRGRQ